MQRVSRLRRSHSLVQGLALGVSLVLWLLVRPLPAQSAPPTRSAPTTTPTDSTAAPAVRPASPETLTASTAAPAPRPSAQSTTAATPPADPTAARFAMTCTGCHSLAGAKLTGPDLTPTATWTLDQLRPAVQRMEKNVGPLTATEVESLAVLLRAPGLRDRVLAAQARIQAQFRASLAPPDAAAGRALFEGTLSLRHGGLACAACHQVQGRGGNLGPDLSAVATRLGGEVPLISAVEKAGFRVMAPHYQRHPVTAQEALHLSRYLATLDPAPVPASAIAFVPLGAGAAAAFLLALTTWYRTQRQPRPRHPGPHRRPR